MKIGGAVQSLQALQLSSLLITCYLIANPEYTPSPIRPYVSYIRECIAFVFSTIFSGWWPLMAGKIALSMAAVFLSYRLVRVQKEKKEEKHNEDLEKENSERMRRAREEAQRKLQELAAAQLLAEQQSETHTKELLDTSFKYDVAETELGATNEGGKVNGEIQKNDLETEMHSLETKLSGSKAYKSGNRAVGPLISESNHVEQHRRWVEKAQQDVNEAAVAAAVCKINGLVLNEAPSPASDSKRTLPEAAAAAAAGIRSVAAAGPTATLKPSASSSSLVRSKGTGSSSNMIPLAVAQEANERQQQWLQQLQHGLDAPERARAAALDQERALRREQDDEYHKALEEDMNRLKEAEALRALEQAKEEEEKRRKAAAEAHLTRLKAAREEARTALRGEPEESASTLLVRVRLPSGAQQQRRFILADQVSEVEAWVDTLEEIPLGEERSWRMMTSFPRAVLGSSVTLQEVADGSTAVALFIELTS